MKFKDFFCFKAAIAQLQSGKRDEAVEELVSSLEKCGKLPKESSKSIIKAIIKRENEASTGLGRGVAIPHVKHKAVDEIIATIGLSDEGIDFFALDKMPVHSIILMLSPLDDPDKHLQAMENIFKHLQIEKFRKFLRQCRSQDQIKDLFMEADEDPSL
ncbi:MAG: PTS sugar transporter subunit IIA [Sedimentisphaerales bacterium]|nr:PTS sugar transporter subunit IIA [Sedimentisphaerales bacterium]